MGVLLWLGGGWSAALFAAAAAVAAWEYYRMTALRDAEIHWVGVVAAAMLPTLPWAVGAQWQELTLGVLGASSIVAWTALLAEAGHAGCFQASMPQQQLRSRNEERAKSHVTASSGSCAGVVLAGAAALGAYEAGVCCPAESDTMRTGDRKRQRMVKLQLLARPAGTNPPGSVSSAA